MGNGRVEARRAVQCRCGKMWTEGAEHGDEREDVCLCEEKRWRRGIGKSRWSGSSKLLSAWQGKKIWRQCVREGLAALDTEQAEAVKR